ncbi:MAG TPA: signal peptidase I [Chthonomonadaceae bacterium]|nr:signal peptidase I [Chthonomonadaceae bacterium]
MNPATDVGASEILANLSIGAVLLLAFALTLLRLLLLSAGGQPQGRPGAASEAMGWARGLAEILESLIIAGVLVFLIIRPFFLQAFYIPSESMENTLLGHDAGVNGHDDTVHDHIFVNKLVYRYSDPQRGDIIVFRAPRRADMEDQTRGLPQQENILIKRLIGVPGDTIEIKNGAVYRNGQKLNEPYIKEPMQPEREADYNYGTPCGSTISKPTCGPVHLGKDELWVMGDNRNNSNDSRYWGTLNRKRVIGKAMLIFWPLNRIRLLTGTG